jgi:hypothetical protein
MKTTSYVAFLGLSILACDDSENARTITEYEGVSVVFSWKGIEPRNHDNVVFSIYNPDSQEFWGQDSVFFSYYHPDVEFTVKVQITEPLKHNDYVIDVIGHYSGDTYRYENSFSSTDPVGLAKTSLYITKNKYDYTLRAP